MQRKHNSVTDKVILADNSQQNVSGVVRIDMYFTQLVTGMMKHSPKGNWCMVTMGI